MTNNYIINTKSIEDLNEWQKMILSIKGAVEEIKNNSELKNAYGAFIYVTIEKLNNEYGISKDEIFKYKFNFIK